MPWGNATVFWSDSVGLVFKGGAIPVALPVFLDDSENKSSDEQGVSDDESCMVEERVESNDIEIPNVENDEEVSSRGS